jgi:ATP-binding cassette subfamily B protein
VTQETLLFADTIAENISYGRPGASRDDIVDAAKHAHAHEFISALPEGYDTVLSDRGQNISGGQAQRIAIARAFLKNPAILILDEATSALDAESEEQVQKAMAKLMQGRTVLIIAHRLSALRRADQFVVLDRGRIVEIGRHDELMERDGVYRRLYELQVV